MSQGFARRFDNPLVGCVGAIDGIAIQIVRPSTANSQSYFNRKGFFSINLQAMCYADYIFTYASCRAAGSSHDSLAFEESDLSQALAANGLPGNHFIVGDEAYVASDFLLTPWPGRDLSVEKDAFNFWLSNSRIHIEQALGQLVARFGILGRP